jgi:hypothetical protein
VAQNILAIQRLEIDMDYKVKKAETELKRAQKEFKSAKEEREIRLEALKRKGKGYRANVKAAEEVMRGRDGW